MRPRTKNVKHIKKGKPPMSPPTPPHDSDTSALESHVSDKQQRIIDAAKRCESAEEMLYAAILMIIKHFPKDLAREEIQETPEYEVAKRACDHLRIKDPCDFA